MSNKNSVGKPRVKLGMKLAFNLAIPIFFMVIIGVSSYSKAVAGITNSFKTSITETLSMVNEYIELAKEYSGDKNYMFINGILTEIMRDLKIFKAETLK